jgi:cell division protein FtsI/penicillin-binding protein 2
LIDQVQDKNPTPISTLNPSISLKLQKIVEQLMRKKAGRRFANAGEVVLALQDELG